MHGYHIILVIALESESISVEEALPNQEFHLLITILLLVCTCGTCSKDVS